MGKKVRENRPVDEREQFESRAVDERELATQAGIGARKYDVDAVNTARLEPSLSADVSVQTSTWQEILSEIGAACYRIYRENHDHTTTSSSSATSLVDSSASAAAPPDAGRRQARLLAPKQNKRR